MCRVCSDRARVRGVFQGVRSGAFGDVRSGTRTGRVFGARSVFGPSFAAFGARSGTRVRDRAFVHKSKGRVRDPTKFRLH